MADVDTALEQQILDLSQRQWVADIHHHREADDFGRTVEVAEGISHLAKPWMPHLRINPFLSDNARRADTASCNEEAAGETDGAPASCHAGRTALGLPRTEAGRRGGGGRHDMVLYAEGLEERLLDLHRRVQSGAYRALPVRRVEIPKPDGGHDRSALPRLRTRSSRRR